MTGELTAHLNRADQEAREQVETLVKQMVEKQGVTEQLKMQDLMKWVGLMNNIKACAGRNCIEKYDIYVGGKRQSKRSLFLFCVYWNSILK